MTKNRTILIITDDEKFELAVNPPELTVSQGSKDKTIDLLNVGEVNVPGNRGLIKVSLSAFLPDVSSPFYRGYAPERIIQSLKKAKNGKKSIRIIISGTDVNTRFTIASVSETYKEGQTDIYVDWSFTEDRDLNTQGIASWVRRYTDTGLCERKTTCPVPKIVTIKQGDTLWNLAKRFYDDGSRWRDIADINALEEDNLEAGMRLIIPQ